jgi:hypothetical protein
MTLPQSLSQYLQCQTTLLRSNQTKGNDMSTYVPIASACGRVMSSIDIFDLDLNPNGVICCPECSLIIESRNAWESFEMSDPHGSLYL